MLKAEGVYIDLPELEEPFCCSKAAKSDYGLEAQSKYSDKRHQSDSWGVETFEP